MCYSLKSETSRFLGESRSTVPRKLMIIYSIIKGTDYLGNLFGVGILLPQELNAKRLEICQPVGWLLCNSLAVNLLNQANQIVLFKILRITSFQLEGPWQLVFVLDFGHYWWIIGLQISKLVALKMYLLLLLLLWDMLRWMGGVPSHSSVLCNIHLKEILAGVKSRFRLFWLLSLGRSILI